MGKYTPTLRQYFVGIWREGKIEILVPSYTYKNGEVFRWHVY